MGALGFLAGVLTGLMAMGKWHESGSPYWLLGGILVLSATVIGVFAGRKG